MQIISRAQWGARHRDGFEPAPVPFDELWLHHSVTLMPDVQWIDADGDGVDDDEERALRALEQIGQDRFGGGISYTWAIPPSGRIYQGHSVDQQGAHTGGRNNIARAIVLIGNYDEHQVTEAQKRSAAAIVRMCHDNGWRTSNQLNGGHNQAPGQIPTKCPGRYGLAAIPEINRLAGSGEPLDLEDDMFTDEDRELLKNIKGYLYAGGADADADDPLSVPGVSRRSVFGRTVDMHGALASAWESTGKNVGQLLADLAERPDVTLSPDQVQEISDNLAHAGLPAAFVDEFRRAIGAPTGGTA